MMGTKVDIQRVWRTPYVRPGTILVNRIGHPIGFIAYIGDFACTVITFTGFDYTDIQCDSPEGLLIALNSDSNDPDAPYTVAPVGTSVTLTVIED